MSTKPNFYILTGTSLGKKAEVAEKDICPMALLVSCLQTFLISHIMLIKF